MAYLALHPVELRNILDRIYKRLLLAHMYLSNRPFWGESLHECECLKYERISVTNLLDTFPVHQMYPVQDHS